MFLSDHILGHSHRLHPTLVWDLHDRRSHIELARTIKKNRYLLVSDLPK